MIRPRARVLLPLAVVATVLQPALRMQPGFAIVPDIGWLLLLWAVRLPSTESWKRPILLVFIMGILRVSVSATSPFAAWAGYGGGLLLRGALDRRLSEYNIVLRFLVGFGASLPLAFMDTLSARSLGGGVPEATVFLYQAVIVGVIWALLRRPAKAAWRREGASR